MMKEKSVKTVVRKENEEKRNPPRQRNKPKYLEDYNLDEDDVTNAAVYSIDYCYCIADIPSTY